MDDILSIHQLDGAPSRGAGGRTRDPIVYFIRPELTQILNIYGRMVATGSWCDYAIDHLPDMAVFSVFRRASEMPLYRIVKEPAKSGAQGAWRILGMDGQVLKRGKLLDQLLRFFDRQLLKAVD